MAKLSANWYIKAFFSLLLIVAISGYIVFRSNDFVDGPEITISKPTDGILVHGPLVHIEGTARRVSQITLNDNPIFIDESGNFDEPLLLVYGHNIITLKAQDKFERTVSKQLELIYR